jgi:DNA-binding transcriptional MerR regulator
VRHLDIAEVAQQSGVPASTLRFYDEKGLIASTGRRGLRRLFDPGVLERLALIALGRAAGFSLDEIARMFAPEPGRRAGCWRCRPPTPQLVETCWQWAATSSSSSRAGQARIRHGAEHAHGPKNA